MKEYIQFFGLKTGLSYEVSCPTLNTLFTVSFTILLSFDSENFILRFIFYMKVTVYLCK